MRFDVQPWKTMPPERFALKKLNKKGLNSTLFLKLQQAQLILRDAAISEKGDMTLGDA